MPGFGRTMTVRGVRTVRRITGLRGVYAGRRAAGNERPRDHARAIDRARCSRSVRARRDAARTYRRPGGTNEGNDRGNSDRTQQAPASGLPRWGGRSRRGDQYRTARDIISAIRMRQRDGTHAQADKQQERDTGTPDPRRTAEHRLSLAMRVGVASSHW